MSGRTCPRRAAAATSFSLSFLLLSSCNRHVVVDGQEISNSTECPDDAIWCDEFEGDRLDPLFWDFDLGNENGWGNSESQVYATSNAVVTQGQLRLHVTKREDDPSMYQSARIKTQGRVSFQFVTLEASIRIPQSLDGGLWPAFWLLGENFPVVGWPQCGEMDIAEWGSLQANEQGRLQETVSSASHWADPETGNHTFTTEYFIAERGLHEDFHRYKIDWTPNTMSMFLDDQLIYTKDITNDETFQKPFFLLLNVAVGGTYTGIFNPNPPLGALEVEWVRAYDNGSGSVVRLLCSENTENCEDPLQDSSAMAALRSVGVWVGAAMAILAKTLL